MDLGEPGVNPLLRSVREPEAFAAFYDQHVERLLAYLAKRVYDAEVALDLTAEVFAQGYLGRRRFRGTTDREAKAWLYTIANRQLARYFRKGKAERRALERLGLQLPSLDEDERGRIEDLADLDGLRVELRKELRQLSRADRDALELRIVEELPYAQVASRLGISEHAARARVCRGLKTLAAALDRNPLIKEITT